MCIRDSSLIYLIGFLKKILISPFLSYHTTCIPSSTEYVFRISFGIVVLNPNAISVFVILVPDEPLSLTLLIYISLLLLVHNIVFGWFLNFTFFNDCILILTPLSGAPFQVSIV